MIYLVLLLSAVIFIELFLGFKILADARNVLNLSSKSISVMKSSTMTDREKESFMRTNSVNMMLMTLKFIVKFIVVFVMIYLSNFVILYFYPDLSDELMAAYLSFELMSLLTLVAIAYVWLRNVVRKQL